MAKTANQSLYEATVRHQVHLLRFSEGQARNAAAALNQAEQELLERIAGEMAKGLDPQRLNSLLGAIQELRAKAFGTLSAQMQEELKKLAETEASWEDTALKGSSPVQLNLATVPLETLHAAVAAPIAGIPLDGWLDSMKASEATKLQQAVTQAVLQGQSIDDLVRRIRGTKANGFKDGIMSTTTRSAEALARTAVNHVSNSARQLVWEANSDVVRALRWTSTLDGRTSDLCKSRDGHVAPIGDTGILPSDQPLVPAGARPPAHFNCRSVMVALLDGVELAGDRPFVMDARTRADREKAFKAEAKERGVPIQQIRQEWADKYVGRVPSATSYQDWLKGQPKEFQNEVLGVGKAELFRSGVPLERFVDKSGKVLTLKQLQAEIAGDALNVIQPAIGVKAKGLLMQGMQPEDVLSAIKAEFTEASTSMASLASYKSELKKAGLLTGQNPGFNQLAPNANTAAQLNILEEALPPGVKNAIGGQWASVAASIDGHPGAYAHYKPGIGVTLSDAKLSTVSKAQAQQVMAHELGHYLHKVHDLKPTDSTALAFLIDDMKVNMAPDLQKLYAYYGTSQDELWAEIVGQALHESPVTSQGVSAEAFNNFFSVAIAHAKEKILDKFPDAPPMPAVGQVVAGIGEIAGKPTSIGGYAKALMQQGMTDNDVLAAVLAEFPSAKTTMNSIKYYKSELKKLAGTPGPVATSVPLDNQPFKTAIPPVPNSIDGEWDMPDVPIVPGAQNISSISGLKEVAPKPGGSNPGAIYTDVTGKAWLVKGNLQKANGNQPAEVSNMRAFNEVLASKLLRHSDANLAPEMRVIELEGKYGGGKGVQSAIIDGFAKFNPKNYDHIEFAKKDFALHSWLGNWDVVGADFDNLVIKNGKAVNIDPGGSMLFRAQGLLKDDFGVKADDWETMRQASVNPNAAKVYGNMTAQELKSSAMALIDYTDDVIEDIVKSVWVEGLPYSQDHMVFILKSRRDDILKRSGVVKATPPPPVEAPAPVVAAAAPAVKMYKTMTAKELLDELVPVNLEVKSWQGQIKNSQIVQKAAVPLFKAGLSTEKVQEVLVLKFGAGYVPKLNSLASMKSKLKKQGLLDGPIGTPLPSDTGTLATPKLWNKSLGGKSSGVKENAKAYIQQGQTAEQVKSWIASQFSSPNPEGAADLYELALYEVKTGKAQVKPGVAASVYKSFAEPVPIRSSVRPGDSGPPPPRFDKEGWQAGLSKYGGLNYATGDGENLIAKVNKIQKAAGLQLLEAEELAAIKAYTGSAYRAVNMKIRDGLYAGDLFLQAWTDAAMSGLHKLAPWRGTVVRGMSLSSAEVEKLSKFYKVGAIVEETQFTSTSDAQKGSGVGGNVRYTIRAKTGRDVRAISSFTGEQEILLVPGTKYKVISAVRSKNSYGDETFNIEMEEL
jgi:SPP1 gp7 family putative phage head morphogenesis protein